MRDIVKVQLPLMTNEPDPFALVYNESRTVETGVPVADVADIMLGEVKQFFYYKLNGTQIEILGIAPWQEW